MSTGFALLNPEPPYSLMVVSTALCLPAVGRNVLSGNPEYWSVLLARCALGLLVAVFLLSLFKERLSQAPGAVTALFGLLALYCSAFFWLWSDPNVIRAGQDGGNLSGR